MTVREILESRVIRVEMLGGWVVQVRTRGSGRHWYIPEEETTYGVLDSQTHTAYATRDLAEARLKEIVS